MRSSSTLAPLASPAPIIEASSTIYTVSLLWLSAGTGAEYTPGLPSGLWRYILRWIVYAGCPEELALNTLAARPVGASSITGRFCASSTLTSAPVSEVLPVPAYPLRMNTDSAARGAGSQKRASAPTTATCCSFGRYGRAAMTSAAKSSGVISSCLNSLRGRGYIGRACHTASCSRCQGDLRHQPDKEPSRA